MRIEIYFNYKEKEMINSYTSIAICNMIIDVDWVSPDCDVIQVQQKKSSRVLFVQLTSGKPWRMYYSSFKLFILLLHEGTAVVQWLKY
jgi:hypothetical protein